MKNTKAMVILGSFLAIIVSPAIIRTDTYYASWSDPLGTSGTAGEAVSKILYKIVREQGDDRILTTAFTETIVLRDGKTIGPKD